MKLAKKLASLTLALVMILALSVPALASGGDTPAATGMEGELTGGSITINDAMPGETYKAYQVLYLESYDADKGVYSYKANSEWEDCLKTNAAEYLAFDEQGYVTWKSNDGETQSDIDARAAAFAALLKTQLTGKTPAATQEAPAAAEGQEYSTVTMENLMLGYYLVDTTTGALCSLDTTNPGAVMKEKNEKPTIDKQVQEDSKENEEGSGWQDDNDADIGQTVNFKTTVHAKKGAENYVVHDKMSEGLTFDENSVVVKVGEIALTKGTDYMLDTNPQCGHKKTVDGAEQTYNCTFTINFTKDYLDTITEDTDIVITYSATLNENAVIADEGNPNDTKLDYGDESHTEWDQTITYTWEMGILKYGNEDTSKVLKDAQFVLLNSDKNKVATIENGKVAGWKDVPLANEDGTITWPDDTVLTTNDNGKIDIDGLDGDTYYLRETKAPDGYNKLKDDVTITIDSTDGAVNKNEEGIAQEANTVKVNNNSGTELPSTGGIGTTIFYAVGGVLVLAAVILLVAKKRMAR